MGANSRCWQYSHGKVSLEIAYSITYLLFSYGVVRLFYADTNSILESNGMAYFENIVN